MTTKKPVDDKKTASTSADKDSEVASTDTVKKPTTGSEKAKQALNSSPVAKATASKAEDVKKAEMKISAVDKKAADDSIKSKKSIEELKTRAHEAKQRAQQKILDKSFVSDKPTDPLERLANTFDSSARRWEMVVYPSVFAFVLLAGYGFFLIYRLTHDIATLSQSVTHMAVIVSDAMPRMTKDLNSMTGSMDNMTENIAGMSGDVEGMTNEIISMSVQMNSLTPMSNNIQSLTHNIGSMNRSVYGMQRDMHGMNRTVSSGPFGMMNDIMPFSSDSNVPPPMPPEPVWPAYNSYQNNMQYPMYAQPRVAPVTQAAPQAKPPQAVEKKAAAEKTKGEITMPGASPVTVKSKPAKQPPAKETSNTNPWTNR